MAHEDPEFLSVHQAAAFLGVHPNTIRRWANQEQLPAKRIGTRGDWRFTKEALQQLMWNGPAKSNHVQQTPLSALPQHTRALSTLSPTELLAQGGEMGLRIKAMDWTQTSIGPVEQWPKTLVTLL